MIYWRIQTMQMKSNTIITLENGEKYMVLNEAVYEQKKYYLVMGVDQNKEIIQSKVAIFKEEKENNETYVTKVEDSNEIVKLTQEFKEQV